MWLNILYSTIIIVGLLAIFIVSMLINKKIKKPKGCNEFEEHSCGGCTNLFCKLREDEDDSKVAEKKDGKDEPKA